MMIGSVAAGRASAVLVVIAATVAVSVITATLDCDAHGGLWAIPWLIAGLAGFYVFWRAFWGRFGDNRRPEDAPLALIIGVLLGGLWGGLLAALVFAISPRCAEIEIPSFP